MVVRKPGGYVSTATERMEAARAVKRDAVTRELLWVSIASRIWPAFLARANVAQKNWPLVCLIDTPAGRLAYRVSDDERPLFAHLEQRENDGAPADNKIATLHALATNDW